MISSPKVIPTALALGFAMVSLTNGLGATRVVENLGDGPEPGTLRSVLAAAQSGEVIVFAEGLQGTITLGGGRELRIDKDLTLRGHGAGQLTVRGNGAGRDAYR